jgi:putative NADH-flavin reductase
MKIVIFGATSKTGLQLTEQALEAGHEVTAFVRDPSKLTLEHPRLAVVQGDALDPEGVERAVQGQEGVISLIGPTKGSPSNITTRATRNILAAMDQHSVRRLVVASVAGIPTERDQRGLVARLVGGLIQLFLGDMYKDRQQQLELLQQSDRDWIVIRLPRLTDAPATGHYTLDYQSLGPSVKVTRADLAAAMLQQLTDDTYLHQAPIISN